MSQRCVTMIQLGARRNYTYGRQLEDAGLLENLVTDASWSDQTNGLLNSLIRRIGPRRKIVGVHPDRIVKSILPNVAAVAKLVLHEENAYPIIDEAFALALRTRRLVCSEVVVNYLGNGGSFLDIAKRQGVSIVTDFIISPRYLEVEQQEHKRWPGWEKSSISPQLIAGYRRRMSRLLHISDIYLCPSETVARDLSSLAEFKPERVRIVPYGISGVMLKPAKPIPGRVLFAGAAGLRKGIPYLAKAALYLKRQNPEINIVVAGAVSPEIRDREETKALTFLGKIGREAMAEEMAQADLFCLPSLAEGSATSVFEAMANGLPIITTPSSGTVVTDGVDGFIVPERGAHELAKAISTTVTDRNLRQSFSLAAVTTANRYSDVNCGAMFIDVIKEVLASRREIRRKTAKAKE